MEFSFFASRRYCNASAILFIFLNRVRLDRLLEKLDISNLVIGMAGLILIMFTQLALVAANVQWVFGSAFIGNVALYILVYSCVEPICQLF